MTAMAYRRRLLPAVRAVARFLWPGRGMRLVAIGALVLSCLAGLVTTTASAGLGHVSTPSASRVTAPAHARSVPHAAPLVTPAPAAVAPQTATVRLLSGDTLWGLAHRYGTTVAQLQTLNHLGDSTLIYAGAELRVPAPTPAAPSPVTQSSVTRTAPVQLATVRVATAEKRPATVSERVATGPIQQVAADVFGSQYACAAHIIARESGWNVSATNRSSGAYGLAQALPGSKMAVAGPDWRTDPATQLRWMRDYVTSRYGGACGAWAFWQAHSWY